jgi:hypothetical protein
VKLRSSHRDRALLRKRAKQVGSILDKLDVGLSEQHPLGASGGAQAHRDEGADMRQLERHEIHPLDRLLCLIRLHDSADDVLFHAPIDPAFDPSRLGIEQAGEPASGSRQASSPVEHSLKQGVDLERSDESLAGFDEGHEVGRTSLRSLVKLRTIDDPGDLVAKHLSNAHVLVGEVGGLLEDVEAQDAYRASVNAERHDDARGNWTGLGDEVDELAPVDPPQPQRVPGGKHVPGDAFADGHPGAARDRK